MDVPPLGLRRMPKRRHHLLRGSLFFLAIVGVSVGLLTSPLFRHEAKATSTPPSVYAAQLSILNGIDTRGLNTTQLKIYTIAKQEFATHATSYDATVMKYTQGTEESWCADFVSWVRQAAGVPFVSPNNGSWRIPGVGTLQAYFQSYNDYYQVGSYTPKMGDVAFYDDTTLSGDNTSHVALVLGVEHGNLITIGGNEGNNGTIQVRSDPLQAGNLGLAGFGDSNLYQ